jgi:predicted transcriptional regulator
MTSAVKNYEKGLQNPQLAYKFSREFLIERHIITDEEQQQLGYIFRTAEAKRRKSERNKAYYRAKKGSSTKQDEIERVKLEIIRLRKNGLKVKEISDNLNVSVHNIEKYITQLYKDGRLDKSTAKQEVPAIITEVVNGINMPKIENPKNVSLHNSCKLCLQAKPLMSPAPLFIMLLKYEMSAEISFNSKLLVSCAAPLYRKVAAQCHSPPYG